MDFEMRRLEAGDMFTMFNILSKIGMKELKEIITPEKIQSIKEMLSGTDDNYDSDEKTTIFGMAIVMEVASIVIKNIQYCKNDIYTLLANLTGMKVEAMDKLDMVTFAELIVAVIQKEEFGDFFKVVSRLFK